MSSLCQTVLSTNFHTGCRNPHPGAPLLLRNSEDRCICYEQFPLSAHWVVTCVQALPPNLPKPMQAGQGGWWVLGSREALSPLTSQPTQASPRTYSLTSSRGAGPVGTSPCGLWDPPCPLPPSCAVCRSRCQVETSCSEADYAPPGGRGGLHPVSSLLSPEVNFPKVWEHPQFLSGGWGCYYFDPTRLSLNLATPAW